MLNTGDLYRHVMAGGGGYGSPYEREPARVLEDVLDGKMTQSHAFDEYGVVLTKEMGVDLAATHARRNTLTEKTNADSH